MRVNEDGVEPAEERGDESRAWGEAKTRCIRASGLFRATGAPPERFSTCACALVTSASGSASTSLRLSAQLRCSARSALNTFCIVPVGAVPKVACKSSA